MLTFTKQIADKETSTLSKQILHFIFLLSLDDFLNGFFIKIDCPPVDCFIIFILMFLQFASSQMETRFGLKEINTGYQLSITHL